MSKVMEEISSLYLMRLGLDTRRYRKRLAITLLTEMNNVVLTHIIRRLCSTVFQVLVLNHSKTDRRSGYLGTTGVGEAREGV